MKTYTVTVGVASVHTGIVALGPEQAKARAHKLRPVAGSDGHYEVLGELQFKRGESFGWDGEFPKSYRASVEVAPDPEPTAPVSEPGPGPTPEAGARPRKGRRTPEAGAGAG